MKTFQRSLSAFALLFALACGGTSTDTSQSCNENHECINGSCHCNGGPKDKLSCCDPSDSSCAGTPSACDTYCKYCQ